VYEQAVAAVEAQATDILGEEYKLESKVDMSITLAAKEELVSTNELKVSLLNQVDEIKKSYVLKVDGVTIGASENRATLQALLDKITSQFTNKKTTDYRFEQDASITYEYTSADTQSDPSAIFETLSANTEEAVTYTVVKGDTYSEIANDNGMRLKELMALNPQAKIDKLMVGDVLNIKTAVPFLSVKTVEKLTYTEAIESPVEYIDDASLYVGDTKTKTKAQQERRKLLPMSLI
jgi:LysM repeat protein